MTRTADQPLPWHRSEPDSPCVNICQIHPTHRICIGCHRTAEEISTWSQISSDERQTILAALPERGGGMLKRRGGRRGRLEREG